MRKVILKCKLKSRDDFEQKLEEIDLEFSPIYWLHDRVYIPKNYKSHQNFPRLVMRTEMKAVDKPPRYSLILKRHIEDSGVDVVETTVVQDYEAVVRIIFQLGFKLASEVSRRRQSLTMGQGTSIFLDKIERDPTYYAKIESVLEANDSVNEGRADLMKTFETLGETNFIESAYFEM